MGEWKEKGRTCIVCRFLYGVANFGIQTVADVDDAGCLLEHAKGFDQREREPFRGTANVKVLERTGIG